MNSSTDLDLGHDEVYPNYWQKAIDQKLGPLSEKLYSRVSTVSSYEIRRLCSTIKNELSVK